MNRAKCSICPLLDLHAQACDAGNADPIKLARWMVRFRFDDQDFFEVDPVRYADALGDLGLAAYRREVKQRIEAGGGDSFGAKYAQERLAMLDGDAEALVGLLGGDLSRPYQFIRVAEAMAELGRDDDILSRGCLAGARGPSGLGSGAAAVVALGRGP